LIAVALYVLGVLCASAVGFLSPLWFLGFGPLAAGLIWAAYGLDFEREVASGTPPAPRERHF
jgi:hypothetical protein